jgi:hypothetical protein
MKILFGDFNAKAGKEEIFEQKIWNENLHKIIKNSRVKVVNFATSKNLTARSTMFPYLSQR